MAGASEALSENILEQAAAWRRDGRGVAIATVVATWGSSPRPVGSQLAVDAEGNMVGSVSGGCIEGAVVREAQEVIAGAKPRLLDYGVTNEQAWDVGLACGGKLQIWLEALE
jgi:xanthine/CO dehydrogenase XdhC/CoxF family maturation factor